MDRQGIRQLAAEELQIPTGPYRFAESLEEMRAAVDAVGIPCVVKPVMSSSGKGQSTVKAAADIETAWTYAMALLGLLGLGLASRRRSVGQRRKLA